MASHITRSGKLGYLRDAIDSTVSKLMRHSVGSILTIVSS